MAVLTPPEIAWLVHSVGFDRTGARKHRGTREDAVAVAIVMCESGGDTTANPQKRGVSEDSRGLFQIYMPVWQSEFPDGYDFYDAGKNARAAFYIFQQAGRKFGDWSCYNNGGYLPHINKAVTAVKDPVKPSEASGAEGFARPGIESEQIGLLDGIRQIVAAVAFLTDPDNWKRVALFVGGGALIVVSLVMFLGPKAVKAIPAGKIAKAVTRGRG